MRWQSIVDDDVPKVIALWQACGLTRPWNDPAADIAFARAHPHADILVPETGGQIQAAIMVGHDGHRGSVYYAGVDPAAQGQGLGRAMMAAAEDWLRAQGVWKINLLVRDTNAGASGFYQALGYQDQQCTVWGKRLDGRPDRATDSIPVLK